MNCNEINQTASELKMKFEAGTRLSANDLDLLVDLTLSARDCSGEISTIDSSYYKEPLETITNLTNLNYLLLEDNQRHYVKSENKDYFWDATATSGDYEPFDKGDNTLGFWIAVGIQTSQPQSYIIDLVDDLAAIESKRIEENNKISGTNEIDENQLETASKIIIGAINEIKGSVDFLGDRDSEVGGQLGYKIIRSDFDFTQDLSSYSNSVWEIRYVHNLNNERIVIPEGVLLSFNGGSFENGTLEGNATSLDNYSYLYFTDIVFEGNWSSVGFYGVNTINSFKGLPDVIVEMCKGGIYEGVKLKGYYEKGDTQTPINYYISDTEDLENDGDIISVGDVKFEHKFKGLVNPRYYGANPSIEDNYSFIQKCIDRNDSIEIDDAFTINVAEIVGGTYNTSTSLLIEGDKLIEFTANGSILFGNEGGNDRYYPAFAIINNAGYKVTINNPDFIYTGDFKNEDTPDNNKWNLGLLHGHLCAPIFIYDSDVTINNFTAKGLTLENVYNAGISVHHSRVTINTMKVDDYCLGFFASRKNYDVEKDFIQIDNIIGGRQSQKAFLVYGPPHLIYMNGHANFQATNVIDRGEISLYNGDELMVDGNSFTPYVDGHTVKVVNGTGGVNVTNVISNRMEGVLDATNSSDISIYDNIVWEIDDFIQGYYDWGAIRIDRGSSGDRLPVVVNAVLKMKDGDRKFVDLRSDSAELNINIEQVPTLELSKPVVNATLVKGTNIDVKYLNNTNYQPVLVTLEKASTDNFFNFYIIGNRSIFGGVNFLVDGVQVPLRNKISFFGLPYIDMSKITQEGYSYEYSSLRDNILFCGENGLKRVFKYSGAISNSASSFNLDFNFLPTYNNSLDELNVTTVAAGDFYVMSQDFIVKKFGGNAFTFNTLRIKDLGWFVNGSDVSFSLGDGVEPMIGDYININGVEVILKQINISSGTFATGDASGIFKIEYAEDIPLTGSGISGSGFTASFVSKNNSAYEGFKIDKNELGGLKLSSLSDRNSNRSYDLYLTIKSSFNYR